MHFNSIIFSVLLLFFSPSLVADTANSPIKIAVASNFMPTARAIAANFEATSPHRVVLIAGSTGKIYAQIKNGAPFDAFFAADQMRPQRLEQEGLAIKNSRFTYAIGKLVLWSPENNAASSLVSQLKTMDFRHLAIANPKLAPYGLAAKSLLQNLGLWPQLKTKIVRGENIGQAFQFVKTGNAALGLIAYAQLVRTQIQAQTHVPGQSLPGSFWLPPQNLYEPITQQAVMLKDNQATLAFMAFVQNEDTKTLIRQSGYATP